MRRRRRTKKSKRAERRVDVRAVACKQRRRKSRNLNAKSTNHEVYDMEGPIYFFSSARRMNIIIVVR